jgi:ribosomal protein S18 acetylase RimI-like enzyme
MNALTWLVRAPTLADIDPLAEIATAVSQSHTPMNPDTIRWSMDQLDGRFWTITQYNQPIGYATLLPLPGLPNLFELTGGIDPQFQRQGAGSYLWRTMRQELGGTAVQQITYSVDNLKAAAAQFLRRHQFTLEHEEWTLQLQDLQAAEFAPSSRSGQLKKWGQATAVRTLPTLYDHCFVGTPWFQAYTAAEVAATWEPQDELWILIVGGQTIGFAWLHFPEPTRAEIEPIGIVKEKQGKGYGRFLLTSLLQQLQERDIETISLGVWANNETAVQLYQSVGFHHISSSYSLIYTFPPT